MKRYYPGMLVLIDKLARVVAAVSLLALCACTTIDDVLNSETKVDYKKGYDFDDIKTVTVACIIDTESDDSPLTEEQIERVDTALARAIERRGLTVVDNPAEADAQVSWHVVTQEQSSLRSYNAQSYYHCWRCGPAISSSQMQTYTEGTFVVDIIDPEISKSVWRGLIKGRLADATDADTQQSRFDKAAREMFAKYPPGFLIDGIY